MDVDNELDGNLLRQFSSLGTTDKEVLISEFQKLLGPNQLSPEGCGFFLDMNNWNLQAAVCAYYDFDQPSLTNIRLPVMCFVKDVTIGEGEAVPPSTKFIKTWRIKNIGEDAWPPGCNLRYCCGDNLSNTDRAIVNMLVPGQEADVSVEMESPAATGVFQSQWRMSTPTGLFFGEVIWVIITVDEGGLLGVTQQLSSFGKSDFVHSNIPQNLPNPFASPIKLDLTTSSPLISPNSSIIAQHGSPLMSQPSPTVPTSSPVPVRALFNNFVESENHREDNKDSDMS
ncbi:protein ILRUN-like [Mytilus californianus]|uniref:protein ILRUN-like n=1 Tax=Mytilus californianus TaxID=6549 RepID=UPI002247FE41|nr:protein ILRUN-like [Mytilus californianus]